MNRLKDVRLLVVDDEEVYRSMLETMLEPHGIAAAFAASADCAIEMLQAQQFDVIILDVHMPQRDGTQVLRYARQYHPTTEVIMLTGTEEVNIARECMKLGAFDFVTKPFAAADLIETITKAYSRRRQSA